MLPWDTRDKAKVVAQKVNGTNNLKQAALGLLLFNQDHDDRYPIEAAYLEGGSAEALPKELKNGSEDPFTWMHFGAMRSQLENPKICICPSDSQTDATTFDYASRDRATFGLGPIGGAGVDSRRPKRRERSDRGLKPPELSCRIEEYSRKRSDHRTINSVGEG